MFRVLIAVSFYNCLHHVFPFPSGFCFAVRLLYHQDELRRYAEKSVVTTLGVFDTESETVDVDAIYAAAKPYMGAEPPPVKIPLLKITIRMGNLRKPME